MSQCYIRRKQIKQSFTPVDYIKFDGTTNSEYDTGISAGNKRVSVTFDLDGSTSAYGGIFGLNGTYPKSYIKLKYNGDGQFYTSTGSSQTSFTVQYSDYGKHTFINNINGKNLFDGAEVTAYSTYTSSYTYRFGVSTVGSSNYRYKGKIYEIKITDNTNDNVLLWCTPVSYIDSGTTKYGFYDSVSGTLITRTGWTGGNDVVELVPWATGTPEKIAAMLQAHDDGIINIYDYWNVGDERTVSLSAISSASGGFERSMDAQDIVMVLMNEGYDNQSGIHYVVGQKNELSQKQRMNSSTTTTYGWQSTDIYTALNGAYRNAFPEDERALYKQFTQKWSINGTTMRTKTNYFALFAEKEVFGVTTKGYAEDLSQITYFLTATDNNKGCYLRTKSESDSTKFCGVTVQGRITEFIVTNSYGIAPFGCI